ncbi:uncharacterized protein FA14DRAFT_177904 [Meira miltonrushii]|uniref:Uncharacterized protein n=1 Tax=Meira miltonrushii TaxID=1280837 RepID=A0A316VA69_9BASI|nr:uncharacterized protein FA14DRAFT_177904 [Meira miltonrushii]PWN34499.1 hypothetical protein FA14DRAFT_177904 [Meira miltonrushii]
MMNGVLHNNSNQGNSIFARLPAELIYRILYESASSCTTKHARNVCMVSRGVYNECWPTLWRIVALRNAVHLKMFSELIYKSPSNHNLEQQPNVEQLRLRKRQDAIECLYLNNNKDANGIRSLKTDEKPEMWMISILLAAKNLNILHVEEYWSMSYPWEAQEDKPLIAYPIFLLSRFFTAVHAAFASSPKSQWVHKMFGEQERGGDGDDRSRVDSIQNSAAHMDIYEAILDLQRTESLRRSTSRLVAQLHEITLSALAMSPNHLTRLASASSGGENRLPNNDEAFDKLTHLHLYFAKLDNRMIEALLNLPALTHLRLTRPFSELLYDGTRTLLGYGSEPTIGSTSSRPRLQKLIIEAGIYMDRVTVERMSKLESSYLGQNRLKFICGNDFPSGPYRAPETETVVDQRADGSSTAHVINYVTTSEERGFQDFVRRAHGREGVWST